MSPWVARRAVSTLPGIGPKRFEALTEAGITTLLDLLLRIPRSYSDTRSCLELDQSVLSAALGSNNSTEVTVEGRLEQVRRIFTRRQRMSLVRGQLIAPTGRLHCVWFNQPYLAKQVRPGQAALLCGKLRLGKSGFELVNPEIHDSDAPRRLVPHYAPLAGLGRKTLRRAMTVALDQLKDCGKGLEDIPQHCLQQRRLPRLGEALETLHRPGMNCSFERLQRGTTRSHHRLIYGALFHLQLELLAASTRRRSGSKPHMYKVDDRVRAVARESLPFSLTKAQRKCLQEIVTDLRSERPMLRLLQGDVGCGKTIVAAIAGLVAAESGVQTAFLSPTEVLAEQLANQLRLIYRGHHPVALLTGSTKDKDDVLSNLASGAMPIVSGTHALLQENVRFSSLGLVVIDEQHRFGVEQRSAMTAKGATPDVLLMTATPIPRSLALAVFGDLELSSIDELPPGRKPVITRVLPDGQRAEAVQAVRAAVTNGGRAFVVFPRIDDSEVNRISLESHAELYLATAPGRVGIVTGRTKPEERSRILAAFRTGELLVLLATTVIEVGIDVPEATLMVVEGAEHFGLSQLHQLRGRVGRSDVSGRCLALYSPQCRQETRDRLRRFESTLDGFELAEIDLRTRGPGNLLGSNQSGFSHWSASQLAGAMAWLEPAREDARKHFEEAASSSDSTTRGGAKQGAGLPKSVDHDACRI